MLLLFSCGENRYDWGVVDVTPAGYRIIIPLLHEVDKAIVKEWLDQRISHWIESNPGHSQVPQSLYYIIVDHWYFDTSASPTGYANGESWQGSYIKACIYQKGLSQEYPINAPVHTVFLGADGLWRFGYLPDGTGLAVIPHELDHQIGIYHD